jgi:hypothetical protein
MEKWLSARRIAANIAILLEARLDITLRNQAFEGHFELLHMPFLSMPHVHAEQSW